MCAGAGERRGAERDVRDARPPPRTHPAGGGAGNWLACVLACVLAGLHVRLHACDGAGPPACAAGGQPGLGGLWVGSGVHCHTMRTMPPSATLPPLPLDLTRFTLIAHISRTATDA